MKYALFDSGGCRKYIWQITWFVKAVRLLDLFSTKISWDFSSSPGKEISSQHANNIMWHQVYLLSVWFGVTCDNFVASLKQLVLSRPRDSPETFCLASSLGMTSKVLFANKMVIAILPYIQVIWWRNEKAQPKNFNAVSHNHVWS